LWSLLFREKILSMAHRLELTLIDETDGTPVAHATVRAYAPDEIGFFSSNEHGAMSIEVPDRPGHGAGGLT
jgi:hypothetical protein